MIIGFDYIVKLVCLFESGFKINQQSVTYKNIIIYTLKYFFVVLDYGRRKSIVYKT